MEGICPEPLDQMGEGDAFLHLSVPVVRLHVVVRRVLHQYGEVRPADGLADIDQLFEKAGALFQRATIFVLTGIPGGGEELVREIPPVSVDLNGVRASPDY